MNLMNLLILTLSTGSFGLLVGSANLRLFERLLPQFSQEESDSIMHHRKPLLEGESDASLTDAIDTIQNMESEKRVSSAHGDALVHALQNAKNLRSVAESLGDLPSP